MWLNIHGHNSQSLTLVRKKRCREPKIEILFCFNRAENLQNLLIWFCYSTAKISERSGKTKRQILGYTRLPSSFNPIRLNFFRFLFSEQLKEKNIDHPHWIPIGLLQWTYIIKLLLLPMYGNNYPHFCCVSHKYCDVRSLFVELF